VLEVDNTKHFKFENATEKNVSDLLSRVNKLDKNDGIQDRDIEELKRSRADSSPTVVSSSPTDLSN